MEARLTSPIRWAPAALAAAAVALSSAPAGAAPQKAVPAKKAPAARVHHSPPRDIRMAPTIAIRPVATNTAIEVRPKDEWSADDGLRFTGTRLAYKTKF